MSSETVFNPGEEFLYTHDALDHCAFQAVNLAEQEDFGGLEYADYTTHEEDRSLVKAKARKRAARNLNYDEIVFRWHQRYLPDYDEDNDLSFGIGRLPIGTQRDNFVYKIYAFDLGPLSEGNQNNFTRPQVTETDLEFLKDEETAQYFVSGANGNLRDVRNGDLFASSSVEVKVFTYGEIFHEPLSKDTLVVSFCSDNPIRQSSQTSVS
ncbi:hypothetical protein BU23DRAFT_566157 [Bimuria novae-zelandiae CBS 107.79]|uniref:Uncharacterized protein n=1 Tax=Bimuria novae-zelandiae CBS 107.79 TaxID=1447943 RepID=A0A6A5VJL6_9PLEO|nr:hypothetical protein BU23DRAFT_566157 [Bimuria novae-zelandiae CBS 107.79]